MDITWNRIKTIKRISFAYTALLIIAVSCSLFMISCAKTENREPSSAKEEDTGIRETYDRGPASVTVETDKKEMTIAQRLNLTVTIVTDEDYEAAMPDLAGRLEQFGIVDWHTTQPELTDNNRKRITRTYVLEPFLSGDYTIPSLEVKFSKNGENEADSYSISTSEIIIKVNSLLPEDMEEMKLNDIKPPVPYPQDYLKFALIGGGVLIILAAGVLTWVYVKRRRHTIDAHAVMLMPHEVAYRELDELAAEDLIGRGEIKPYYQRLSGILRRYIEDRFGLSAPEQTTEEFLAGLDMDRDFPDRYRPLLRAFLRHCDMVKFAEFMPEKEDIMRASESCKDFIGGTEEKGGIKNEV